MKIGELLLRERVLGMTDLDHALAQQKQSTLRLGSVVYLLQMADADTIARLLGQQLGVPAALTKHIQGRDATVVSRISSEVAWRYHAMPIAITRGQANPSVVVVFRDPNDVPAKQHLSGLLSMPVIASVACEAVLLEALKESYGEAPASSFKDGLDIDWSDPEPDTAIAAAPAPKKEFGQSIEGFTLVDLDGEGVSRDFAESAVPIGQRQTLSPASSGSFPASQSIPGMPAFTTVPPPMGQPSNLQNQFNPQTDHAAHAAAAIAAVQAAMAAGTLRPNISSAQFMPPIAPTATPTIAPTAVPTVPVAPAAPPAALSLDRTAALRLLTTAQSRDEVGDICVQFLQGVFQTGVVFVVRDGMALGHRGFGGTMGSNVVESLVIPLNIPSMFKQVFDMGVPHSGPVVHKSAPQDRFLKVSGHVKGDVNLAPIAVRGRTVAMLFGFGESDKSRDGFAEMCSIAFAAGEAYERIILSAKKKG